MSSSAPSASATVPLALEKQATLRSGDQLSGAGLIDADAAAGIDAVAARYSVAVPAGLAGLIDADDPDDPIARQFIPSPEELIDGADELADPIGDGVRSPVRGLVHRYPDRVLLMPTMACPVYCRYCFRRERVGRAAETPSPDDMETAFAYIESHPEIREVILTGGDPLSLSDRRLGAVLDRLDAIPHLLNIRLHTRAPVATPERITDGFVETLQRGKPVWMALHCNHPRELTDAVADACDRLVRGGIPLLSQTVLLRGVNDDVAILTELMRRFIALRIKPYYLHHPDKARGTERFRLTLDEGRALVDGLRGHISGLCQPTYVVDLPGGHGKVPVANAEKAPSGWQIADYQGRTHTYRDD